MIHNLFVRLVLIGFVLLGYSGCSLKHQNIRREISVAPIDFNQIRLNYKQGEITTLCEAAIQNAQSQFDEIAKLPKSGQTIQNTLLKFEKITADLSDSVMPLTFMAYVSSDEAISSEASHCEEKISQYHVSVMTRKDLYEVLKTQQPSNLSESRLLNETLKDFEENGLNLDKDTLSQVKHLKQQLAALETQFSTNLNQDKTVVYFSEIELAGLPKEYLQALNKNDEGKLIVPTKEPDYVRVMENAQNPKTREKMLEAFENRAAEANTRLLQKAIQLRHQISKLMGFKNWVDYRAQNRMAKSSESILKFLNELKEKLSIRDQKDLAKLLEYKKKQDPAQEKIYPWDLRYLSYQLKKQDFNLDDEKIRPYFPANQVISGMFEVYSQLLGVRFREVPNADVWAEGVKFYQILDTKNNELLGFFYTDFFPRPGKYGHAAAFSLITGRLLPNGKYSQPIAAIVSNFSSPEGNRPSLLKHDEVETLFHEFGHIMHQTLTRAPYASLSGSSVDQDFVEAPSQMLENWVYSSEILNKISGHYQDPTQKLPASLVNKIIEARDFNQGYFYTRQLMLALLDLKYHMSAHSVDVTKSFQEIYRELIGMDAHEKSHFPASFGHLMGGYDAGYYGYLWSEVFAEDLFTRFEKEGLLNSQVGQEYRRIILEKGKMQDAFHLMKEFLGRDANANAFYRRLHIPQ